MLFGKVSALRNEWREFKKNHPEFEKSKSFKSDIGPQLDKLDGTLSDGKKKLGELTGCVTEFIKIAESVDAGLHGYKAAAKQIQDAGKDKNIAADIENFLKENADRLRTARNILQELRQL